MKKLDKRVTFGVLALSIGLVGGLFISTRSMMSNMEENSVSSNVFSRETDDLSVATESEMVELNNGDSFDIVARPIIQDIEGQEIRMLSYNGSIPGPTIIVDQGDTIKLNITNELDVATTIHPHGINGSSDNDGVPDISQAPIEIGDSYEQTIEFPESGLFWYHPHVREDYAQASGMYANFIVRPQDSASWPQADREHILQLSDISLTDDGLFEFRKDEVTHTLMGRFGNTQLVNGRTDYTVNGTTGEVQRLYLTNTSSVRSYRFEIPGVSLKLVGGDNGFYEKDSFVEHVTVAPSERAIVDVVFDVAGEYEIRNNNPEGNTKLASIQVSNGKAVTTAAESFGTIASRDSVTEEIEQLLADAQSSGISKRLATRVDMRPMFMQGMAEEMESAERREEGEDHEGIEWEDAMPQANAISNSDNTSWSLVDLDNPREDTFDWQFNQDDVVTITVENSNRTMHPMQHPIHLHGQKFIVASINGEPTENRVFKDVVQIPVGDTYELVTRLENKGTWLLHCHISEHMESGMVGRFTVN